MIPVTHEEFFLAYLEGEEVEIPAPVTRKEMYLAYLCGEEVELPIPVTIDEMYLAALCGMINEVPYPVTRIQIIWAQLLKDGESDVIPVTREERYWTNISLQEWATITGNPVSFTAKAAPLRQLSVAFSPVQAGSGDPSPDNVRPISGWSSVTVEQRGKNLFDKSTAVVGKWLNVNTGAEESTTNLYSLSDYIPVKAGQTYTMEQPNSARRWLYDANKTPLAKVDSLIFTPSADGYVRITIVTSATAINTFMVVMGNTLPSEYTPYNPSSRSISINIGQTVYSGTVDVVTGVVVVTGEKHKVSDYTWLKYNSGNNTFYSNIRAKKAGNDNAITDTYAYAAVAIANMPDKSYRGYNNNGNVYIKDSSYADAEEFMEGAANVELWFELAAPQTIQLTPQEVESLAGDNTMWTDGDSLTVEYRSN